MYILSLFWTSFLETFLLYNWILPKQFYFCKFANYLTDSKSRVLELYKDVSFVIFGHLDIKHGI